MSGKRVVTAPNGARWQVGRRWLNKPPRKLWSRRTRDGIADHARWLDPADFLSLGGDSLNQSDDLLTGIALALAAVTFVALLVFVILPLLGVALELALLVGFFTSGLFGRIALGHPWTIEAVDVDAPEHCVRFAVKGWRRSRRAIGALAETIATTGPPSSLPDATPVAADG